jgi:hypothetical protein
LSLGEADTFQCPRKLRPHIYSVVDKTRALGVVMREIEGLRDKLWPGKTTAGCGAAGFECEGGGNPRTHRAGAG